MPPLRHMMSAAQMIAMSRKPLFFIPLLQHQRERTFVDLRYLHIRAEHAAFYGYGFRQFFRRKSIQLLRPRGLFRLQKIRSVAVRRVRIQGELGNEKDLAADIGDGKIRFAVPVLEDAKGGDLFRKIRRLFFRIALADPAE